MISNEERREVANWLRLSGESLGFDNCFAQMLCDVAGTDLPPEDFDAAGYLADLIDRPTCKNLATKPADELLCSECGEHVDIAYMENTDDYHARYCPNCGAEVVE